MNDPLSNNNPYQPWKTGTHASGPSGKELDSQIPVPDEIAARLASARREAIQALEQKQRTRRSPANHPWVLGFGLAAAALSAVIVAPKMLSPSTDVAPLPPALIAAEEDLEFFETLELLEWSVDNESTS